MADKHEIREGKQELRRGEGRVWSVDTSNWQGEPVPADITIIREADNADVTAAFTSTATPTTDGDSIVLPKVVVPDDAETGYYRLDFPFEAGGFSPGIPYIRFLVKV